MFYDIPHCTAAYVCSPSHSGGVEKNAPLSKKERRAKRLLSKTDDKTLWGAAIRNTLDSGTVQDFRKLIQALHDQEADSPEVMKNILGPEAHEALMDLKSWPA